MSIREADLARVIAALVAEEFGRARGRAIDPGELESWTAATRVDEEGIGADSLARLDLVARVNEFFHLHEIGSEDYLVVRRTFGDWADIVAQSLSLKAERVTFRTGGATGEPKPVTHAWAHLRAETAAWAALLAGARRILTLVPPHHIYGFIWTALLPAALNVPVIDLRAKAPTALRREAREGDLVVATPFLWEHVIKAGLPEARHWTAVTSSAPAPDALWTALAPRARTIEVYGSTETAGIGWREAPDAPFAILPYWTRVGDRLEAGGQAYPVQDRLEWRGPGAFIPAGRLDGAVQVGGVNVFPARVRDAILTAPGVRDCAVRLDSKTGRLKAFVTGEALSEAALEAHARACLAPPERPARWRFGAALPLGALGKPADWD